MGRRPDPRQGGLFDGRNGSAAKGSFNFDRELRSAMSDAIGHSGKSREEIAEEMEELLGSDPDYPISKALIDAWTAPSRTDWRFPVIYLPAFVQVTGAGWLLDGIAKRCGRVVISDEEARDLEIGRLKLRITNDQQRLRDLLKQGSR